MSGKWIADPANSTLLARPFDPVARAFLGDAFPLLDGIATEGSRYASVSASTDGLLVHGRGERRIASQLVWYDRSGTSVGTVGEPGLIQNMALASDGRRAVGVRSSSLRRRARPSKTFRRAAASVVPMISAISLWERSAR